MEQTVSLGALARMLRPMMALVVQETLAAATAHSDKLANRLALPEKEAAAMLGVGRHVLRDARKRGEIEACRVGKRIVYTPEALRAYLVRQRCPRSAHRSPGLRPCGKNIQGNSATS